MQVKLEMSTNGTSTSPMATSKGSDDTSSDTTIATMKNKVRTILLTRSPTGPPFAIFSINQSISHGSQSINECAWSDWILLIFSNSMHECLALYIYISLSAWGFYVGVDDETTGDGGGGGSSGISVIFPAGGKMVISHSKLHGEARVWESEREREELWNQKISKALCFVAVGKVFEFASFFFSLSLSLFFVFFF